MKRLTVSFTVASIGIAGLVASAIIAQMTNSSPWAYLATGMSGIIFGAGLLDLFRG